MHKTDTFNFEMEVLNILDTKVYELSEEEKLPVIKLIGLGGPTAYTSFHTGRKRKIQDFKGLFYSIVQQM